MQVISGQQFPKPKGVEKGEVVCSTRFTLRLLLTNGCGS